MMRALTIAAALMCVAPAAAQSTAPPDLARAAHALAAIWRPIAAAEMTSPSAAQTACAGAVEEMAAVDAALPPVITPESLARVRALRGLLIVSSGEDPSALYFFPNATLSWFASGLGVISVLSEADGLIGVHDAAGHDIALQLGRMGGRPILRLRSPEGTMLGFVGCAASPEP